MFSPLPALLVLSSLLALTARAISIPQTEDLTGLSIALSSPNGDSVNSIDDLRIVATVTNVGGAPVKVVQYGGVLDPSHAQSFLVSKGGKDVRFMGVVPQLAVTFDDESFYRVLAPNESVSVEHNLAPLYDFASAGLGEYTFEPMVAIAADVASTSSSLTIVKSTRPQYIKVNVATDVADRLLESPFDKRASNSCEDESKQNAINSGYRESRGLARLAANYIRRRGGDDELYKEYFKTNDPNTIRQSFRGVATEDVATRSLNCHDETGDCKSGRTIAYTVIRTGNIYFCDIYFKEVSARNLCRDVKVNDRKIRGGTVLHEMIHAESFEKNAARADWILDVGYGCDHDKTLSAEQAAHNADNYNCFATQVYKNTACPDR